MRSVTNELFIENLVNDGIALKAVQADLKKGITVLVDGKLRSFKVKLPTWTLETLRPAVLKQYPAAVIVNDMPVAEIIELYRAHGVIAD